VVRFDHSGKLMSALGGRLAERESPSANYKPALGGRLADRESPSAN
jgi:hypothetical protein